MSANIAEMERRRAAAALGGGQKRIDAQHSKGKLTARERLDVLLDEGSFEELDTYVEHNCTDFGMQDQIIPGDGIVTGSGTINGRLVYVFSQDFTVFGGSLSERHAQKMMKVMDNAMKVGAPIIGINDSGGARIQEGVASLGGYAEVFQRNVLASGVVPQISLIMGPCAGGAVYSPAMTDFIFMVKDSAAIMFVTGPDVVKTVTNEVVTQEELGGAVTHTTKSSGVADVAFENDIEALLAVRDFVDLSACENEPRTGVPERPSKRTRGTGSRTQPRHADPRRTRTSPTTCTNSSARWWTRAISSKCSRHMQATSCAGSVGSRGKTDGHHRQPADGAGRRARHQFVQEGRRGSCASATRSKFRSSLSSTCRASCPGTQQELNGIIKHGAKLLFAYAEATVPKITVITRKAYGGAYDVMSSKHLRGDLNYAWPTAEIAVMGAKGAVEIIFRSDIDDPEEIAEKTKEYEDRFANPFVAASGKGYHRRGDPAALIPASALRWGCGSCGTSS